MRKDFSILATLALGLLLSGQPCTAQTVEATHVGILPGQFDLPADKPRAVVILLHGSGSHSRDEDLSAVTEGKASNKFFVGLSQALTEQGLAVLRYDKRNFVLSQAKPQDESAWKLYKDHPAVATVADARTAIAVARQRFPGLPISLVGHSEGTWVALQAAHQEKDIAALGLIGYSGAGLETLVQEQVAHRYVRYFGKLDSDGDGRLTGSEIPPNLVAQQSVLDLDQDGSISYEEFQAGNYSNVLLHPLISDGWRQDEGSLPTAARLVSEATCPLLFFQGEWDNQTPAYYVHALQICEQQAWKKGNKHFSYFANAGHALDPRKSWDDVTYRPTPKENFQRVARELAEKLKSAK